MKKVFSSLFVLLLLLVTLWGLSTSVFSDDTKKVIQKMFFDEISQNDTLFADLFDHKVLSVNHSMFESKLKIAIQTSNNIVSSLLKIDLNSKLVLDVDIYNGPLLFEKTGVSVGASIWYLDIDEELSSLEIVDKINKKQLDAVVIKFGFNEVVSYELLYRNDSYEPLIKGTFTPSVGNGEIDISLSKLLSEKQGIIEADQIHFEFRRPDDEFEKKIIEFKANVSDVLFQYELMSELLSKNLDIEGSISFYNNKLHSNINVKNRNKLLSNYSLEDSTLTFGITDLNLSNLSEFVEAFNEFQNLQLQTEWILKEQSEVPDGQDKIWQLQHDMSALLKKLYSLSNAVFLKDNQPVIKFKLGAPDNDQATLAGGVLPLSLASVDSISEDNSFFSLFKAEAKVTLDETLRKQLNSKLPIKKNKFNLIYKNNKLLMQ